MWQGLHNGLQGSQTPCYKYLYLTNWRAQHLLRSFWSQRLLPQPRLLRLVPLSVSVADVTRSLRKSAGQDGIPGRVLKTCTHQLAGVFTDMFNLSLSLSVVPQCFKTSTIVPIQKTPKASCLNYWRPVALTPIISKCFEKLIRDHICSVSPASLDPLQFTYC